MLKVELGSGDKSTWTDGYKHLDVRQLDGIDYVSDVRKLPFNDDEVDEFLAFHVIEHMELSEAKKALKEWHRCLKSGGGVVIKCPNLYYICSEYMKWRTPQLQSSNIQNDQRGYDLIGWLYGEQNYPENYHFFTYDYWILSDILKEVGFKTVMFLQGFSVFSQNLGIVAIK